MDCENYNPCAGQKPVTAEIDIYDNDYIFKQELHDTIFLKGLNLTFKSKNIASEYVTRPDYYNSFSVLRFIFQPVGVSTKTTDRLSLYSP